MIDTVVTVENVSKRYLVGHQSAQRERYVTLRDIVTREVRNFTRKALDLARGQQIVQGDEIEEFWALKDVSFEVKRGDVVGIIGRNGAGKSTLLKILSRITEPSTGRARIRGRVASLLEVGTGFHSELTGRENIFLNGAILGMTRVEVRRKFDEIVAFAEVENFLDTPVKRYSSGMYVRLAFAVAANLEPEILIVDEVLAVGDVQFQNKCLGKMQSVAAHEGRTILFVSHNLRSVVRFCSRALLLNSGRIELMGVPKDVIARYLNTGISRAEFRWAKDKVPGDETIKLRRVRIADEANQSTVTVDADEPFAIEIEYEIHRRTRSLQIGFRVSTADGIPVFTTDDTDVLPGNGLDRVPGVYVARCQIPGGLLSAQSYHVSFGAHVPNAYVAYFEESVIEFTVSKLSSLGSVSDEARLGVIAPLLPWAVEKIK
jgi:lipopolysaccharide transport system ATP-binding protein